MKFPILYSFKRCPYAMRARMAIKLANVRCEIREIRLNNKPEHMLEASPKGTVPVLILEDKIIDESIEIIEWVLDQDNVFEGNLNQNEVVLSEKLISIFDEKFKYHLDRYKYAARYNNVNSDKNRSQCMEILIELNQIISNKKWIFGESINKLDISILPFIRQFRIANPEWFDMQVSIHSVKRVLNNFLESELLNEIMINYDEWKEGSKPEYFPIFNLSD
ncbi:MAG: glutathione S-transferase N-terminal domain-containing protein [Proteobacteria bacterium]|nr:glutathione S-transferase N-terminal domain-containing protein [Pseudomonadota bacterium]